MSVRDQGRNVSRFLGLSLGGAKSDRTSIAVVDYYRAQEKAFVIDAYGGMGSADGKTADQTLIDFINELKHPGSSQVIAVDAPLTLPPCLPGCHVQCEGYEKCKKPPVRWMHKEYLKTKRKHPRLKHFTPYSQRPVDIYFRYLHMGLDLFQDETMGANLAPQAVRMNYLKRFFSNSELIEVWPKLVLFYLQKNLKLTKADVMSYRNVERGAHIRTKVLDALAKQSNLFIYDGDYKKFISDMNTFDALICAWVAMLFSLGKNMKFKDVPTETGWVQIPSL